MKDWIPIIKEFSTFFGMKLDAIASKEEISPAIIQEINDSLKLIATRETLEQPFPEIQKVTIEGIEKLTPIATVVNIDMTKTNALLAELVKKDTISVVVTLV